MHSVMIINNNVNCSVMSDNKYFIRNIKFALRLYRKYSHHKKKEITMWCHRGVNWHYSGNRITIYIWSKSTCYATETYTMSHVKYVSIKKEKNRTFIFFFNHWDRSHVKKRVQLQRLDLKLKFVFLQNVFSLSHRFIMKELLWVMKLPCYIFLKK